MTTPSAIGLVEFWDVISSIIEADLSSFCEVSNRILNAFTCLEGFGSACINCFTLLRNSVAIHLASLSGGSVGIFKCVG